MALTHYSIWLIQTGFMPRAPMGNFFYGAHNAGTFEAPLGFVVVEGGGRLILVDAGFRISEYGRELEEQYGVYNAVASDVGLEELGFRAGDVDTVVLTHMHWDHIGNIDAFPNATIVVQAAELQRWVWALALPDRMSWLRDGVDPDDVRRLFERSLRGQVQLVEGRVENLLPGIDVIPAFDTHTYGSQMAAIQDGSSDDGPPWLVTGDSIFSYRNLEGLDGSGHFVPIGQATGSQTAILSVFDEAYTLLRGDTSRIVPVHDLDAYRRFPSREYGNGLHIAEVALAPGVQSRLASATP